MKRRPKEGIPKELQLQLIGLLESFEKQLEQSDLRQKVLALIPAFHKLRDFGSSLIPRDVASSARDRILVYFQKYPSTVIHGDELMVISGIQDYPRRIRELRCEFGWNIASGMTLIEMNEEESQNNIILSPEEYILFDAKQDREAAYRWKMANEIRKKNIGSRAKILEFLLLNIEKPVTGEELRYVTNNKSEWARRVRELRTEEGWLIATYATGRPDLPIGTYVLESKQQSPAHDRKISDPVRRTVLVRDNYLCTQCGWSQEQWSSANPRHLELHHVKSHVSGGANTEDNLVTLCNICHDAKHH